METIDGIIKFVAGNIDTMSVATGDFASCVIIIMSLICCAGVAALVLHKRHIMAECGNYQSVQCKFATIGLVIAGVAITLLLSCLIGNLHAIAVEANASMDTIVGTVNTDGILYSESKITNNDTKDLVIKNFSLIKADGVDDKDCTWTIKSGDLVLFSGKANGSDTQVPNGITIKAANSIPISVTTEGLTSADAKALIGINAAITVNVGVEDSAPEKETPKVTAPTANVLTYDGSVKALVTEGSTTGGTLKYALGESSKTAPISGWDTDVPTATDAGSYYVWYKVEGDDAYKDVDPQFVLVEIGKAAQTLVLSKTSGTVGVGDTDTFTVSGNKGGLSVASSDENIANAKINDSTVTVTGVKEDEDPVTITVSAEETSNYKPATATYSVTVAVVYTVTYDANGGSGGTLPVDSKKYKSGDTVTVASITGTMKDTNNLPFYSWNTVSDGSGTSYAPDDTLTISSNITLYAYYDIIYTLTGSSAPEGSTLSAKAMLNSYQQGYIYNDSSYKAYNYDSYYANWADAIAFIGLLNTNMVANHNDWHLFGSSEEASAWYNAGKRMPGWLPYYAWSSVVNGDDSAYCLKTKTMSTESDWVSIEKSKSDGYTFFVPACGA